MFRFKRYLFILTNFLLSIFLFIIIYLIRYSWITFRDVEKRNLNSFTLAFFVFYSFVIIIISIAFKLYELNKITKITESIFTNLLISFISISVFGIFFYITKTDFARFVFFTGFILIPYFLSIFNKILFVILCKTNKPVTVIFLGSKNNYNLTFELFKEYKKIFPVSIKKIYIQDRINTLLKNLKNIKILITDTDQILNKKQIEALNDFEISGGKIYALTDIFSYLDQSLPAEIINNNHYEKFSSYKIDSMYNIFFKRIIDILISIILILILSPLLLLIIILIKITSKNSVFYKQDRITIKNKIFKIFKFRTMKESYSNNFKNNFTTTNDKRITFIGKILRPLRLDELPQLFNVLSGKMSIVGPRPERPEIIKEIIKKYPLFKKRQLVKPGITGWAQVKYPYVNNIKNMNKKLSYDLYYLNNISFIFDLKILLYTIETILFRRGGI